MHVTFLSCSITVVELFLFSFMAGISHLILVGNTFRLQEPMRSCIEQPVVFYDLNYSNVVIFVQLKMFV